MLHFRPTVLACRAASVIVTLGDRVLVCGEGQEAYGGILKPGWESENGHGLRCGHDRDQACISHHYTFNFETGAWWRSVFGLNDRLVRSV